MKFFDLKGREHSCNISPSKWKRKEVGKGRGKFQSLVGEILAAKYPLDYILEEFSCFGEGLFLDFFLPKRMMAVEVQGSQHYSFNKFFHASRADLVAQQKRDLRKYKWCCLNNIDLVVIRHGESEENIKKLLP